MFILPCLLVQKHGNIALNGLCDSSENNEPTTLRSMSTCATETRTEMHIQHVDAHHGHNSCCIYRQCMRCEHKVTTHVMVRQTNRVSNSMSGNKIGNKRTVQVTLGICAPCSICVQKHGYMHNAHSHSSTSALSSYSLTDQSSSGKLDEGPSPVGN